MAYVYGHIICYISYLISHLTESFPYCYLQVGMSHRDSPRLFPKNSNKKNDWLQHQFQYCRTDSHHPLVHISRNSCQLCYLDRTKENKGPLISVSFKMTLYRAVNKFKQTNKQNMTLVASSNFTLIITLRKSFQLKFN